MPWRNSSNRRLRPERRAKVPTIMVRMTYEISVKAMFSASHQLRLYDGSLEPLHGHNWTVITTVAADTLDAIGVVMDFHVLERRLEEVLSIFHDRHLNEVAPFVEVNPSAESVAHYIATRLQLPRRVRLRSVEVWETPENRARVLADVADGAVDKQVQGK